MPFSAAARKGDTEMYEQSFDSFFRRLLAMIRRGLQIGGRVWSEGSLHDIDVTSRFLDPFISVGT